MLATLYAAMMFQDTGVAGTSVACLPHGRASSSPFVVILFLLSIYSIGVMIDVP